jgi:hypothetical protein
VSLQATHLLRDMADSQEIEEGEYHSVEGCQHQRGRPFADLTLIFAQGDIPAPVEPIFDVPMPLYPFQEASC